MSAPLSTFQLTLSKLRAEDRDFFNRVKETEEEILEISEYALKMAMALTRQTDKENITNAMLVIKAAKQRRREALRLLKKQGFSQRMKAIRSGSYLLLKSAQLFADYTVEV
jgi:hypothetical protein